MSDYISRQAAIDAIRESTSKYTGFMELEMYTDDDAVEAIEGLPSAQPERLTDDDFETIRIHLYAIKESLGNQHRFDEAADYQRLLDRFMAFASAQQEIIHCRDCKHWREGDAYSYCQKLFNCGVLDVYDYMREEDDFCSLAEGREG